MDGPRLRLRPMSEWLDPRAMTQDALLAVTTAGLTTLIVLNSSLDDTTSPSAMAAPGSGWRWVLLLLPSLAVVVRRQLPATAAAFAATAQATMWLTDVEDPYLTTGIVLYSAAAHGGRRGRTWAIALSVVLTALTLLGWLAGEAPSYAVVIVALFNAAAVAMGSATADRQASVRATEARAADAERAFTLARITAVAEERNRIARELHDVVAHGLSVIVVQAAAAQRVLDRDPDRARTALDQIEETGRTSLNEMRQVLSALRTDRDESWRPAPGLAALDELAADLAGVGLDVTIDRRELTAEPLPATMDMTAYRIVQESLTNVLKHAGPRARASVVISHRPDALHVTVADNGRGAAADQGGGHGLRGMQERVEVFGGRFRAGPRPGGGYEVVAVLPTTERATDHDRNRTVAG